LGGLNGDTQTGHSVLTYEIRRIEVGDDILNETETTIIEYPDGTKKIFFKLKKPKKVKCVICEEMYTTEYLEIDICPDCRYYMNGPY
jgi:hypothetical protein